MGLPLRLSSLLLLLVLLPLLPLSAASLTSASRPTAGGAGEPKPLLRAMAASSALRLEVGVDVDCVTLEVSSTAAVEVWRAFRV